MTTLVEAQAMLAKYLEAETAAAEGRSVRIGVSGGGIDRAWESMDLDQIRKGRQEWERKVAELQSTAAGVPRFGGVSFSVASFGPN
jgi:hypothetical protein